MSPPRYENSDLVDRTNFLEAMRDAGYRSPASALAELVDNSLEAGATTVEILTSVGSGASSSIEVRDDGIGMSRSSLQRSLLFGGSSRFGSRASLGRFGMGLPTASLSLARHVEVESWRGNTIHRAGLSLDAGHHGIDPVRTRRRTASDTRSPSGTVVRLTNCDRLGYQTRGWLARHLRSAFSATYRTVLADSVTLMIDGSEVSPTDHLLLNRGASRFGDDLRFTLRGLGNDGTITVRFSELPVHRWAQLDDGEKRRLGVLRSEPVSVTRAGREIDRGWFFMGHKPKENYDSWWRCEINFEPALDEHFGVTFTKQRIRPTAELIQLLSADLEPIGRALNSRVRKSFDMLKLEEPRLELERSINAVLRDLSQGRWSEGVTIEFRRLQTARCLETLSSSESGRRIAINTDHTAFRHMYRPLAEVDTSEGRLTAKMVLGAIVAPQVAQMLSEVEVATDWDDVLTALLGRATR
jgi:Histidine kinase-, DNA gyrase B-, and HSP90-like ATPase